MISNKREDSSNITNPLPTPKTTIKMPKKKNKQPQTPNETAASPTDAAPLFLSVTSKTTGVERIEFGTNDTLTMLRPIPEAVVAQQLDTVLHAVRQLDNTCCFPDGCRTKVSLIYLECSLCDRRFCMKHGLPEVHGCGEAIRKAERAEFLRPVPQKTRQREADTKKARERLEQRMKDLQLERRAKPAGGQPKKK